METLRRLAEIRAAIASLQAEAEALTEALRMEVIESGPVEAFGLRAHLKKGRASTDHEAAAMAAQVDPAIIEKHSTTRVTWVSWDDTTKVSVAWAKVTKEAKVDTAPFTTTPPPVFAIDPV